MTPGRRVVDPAMAERYRRRGWWTSATLLDDFLATADRHPGATAVVSHRQGRERPRRHTYAELELASRRCAAALIDLGVERGEAVSVQLPNGWEFPALALGILRAGAVVNPLVPIFRRRELAFILGRTGGRVLVVPDRFRGHDHRAMAAGLRHEVDTLEHLVVVDWGDGRSPAGGVGVAAGDDGTIDFGAGFAERAWEAEPADRLGFDLEAELEARRPGADDLLEIMFTSGTTGEPKGVLHSHNTVRAGGRCLTGIYGLGPDDACFMASTLAHQTGFGYGMLLPLAMGATVVYQDVWDPDRALTAMADEGVVWTVSATAFAMDLVAAHRRADGDRPDLSRFRYFICGGAPIPPKVVEDSAEVLGVELVAVWGMTENMIVTTTRPGDPVELVSDSDGTPVDWMEIRVVGEDGRPVAVGESGDLWCRGPSQALGYFHRDDLYAAASPEEDWFDTGDVARLRPDGGIRIVGRTKDLVIRGGENVPVAEVEDLLLRHPSVAEVAVVAVPDERLGERACAVVTPVAGVEPPTLGQLTAELDRAGMARQFWPERLVVMDEMPHTPSGKVQKFRLRDRVIDQAGP
jgi:cyclohexanecarboxylate-CoA ligase